MRHGRIIVGLCWWDFETMVATASDIRPSPLAGQWYPARADALTAMLDGFLSQVQSRTVGGELLGLLSPHAGLRYSGPVAAHAYTLVKGLSFDTVVVVGPMHHPISGATLTTGHSDYQTPLGTVPIDREIVERIGKRVPLTVIRNDPEHSVEIELPFLQHILAPGFTLVPLMLRDQSLDRAKLLGAALVDALQDRRALLVASSDLSHFYPQHTSPSLDKLMLDRVAAMDAQGVVDHNERRTAFACGYGAIATVLNALHAWGADHAEIVGYGTSGDVTGDFGQVVGYGAAAFWRT